MDTPYIVSKQCVENLRQWTKKNRKSLCFGILMVWREPTRCRSGLSVRFEVGRLGSSFPFVESYQQTSKNGIYSFPAWHSAFIGGCGEQAGKFAYCVLGQGTQWDAPPLCERQVAQTPRKKQLPSECGHIVQKRSDTIHFLVNWG